MPRLRRHRLVLVASFVTTLVALSGYAWSKPISGPRDVAVVTVSSGPGGTAIQPGFLGLSLEADSRAGADGEASAFERAIGKP